MTTNCSPTNVPLAILQTDLNSRTHERCNRSVELSTLRSVPSLGIVPWFPRSFLPQKNPRIVVFRRCRDNTMISFYLSFTDDTIKRKRNARETETTADTKETEKASRYDKDRHLLHDGQFPWTVQKGPLITLELPPEDIYRSQMTPLSAKEMLEKQRQPRIPKKLRRRAVTTKIDIYYTTANFLGLSKRSAHYARTSSRGEPYSCERHFLERCMRPRMT
jgi:hypothetical protein